MSVSTIIKNLEMIPHPEGGFYKENYRSSELVETSRGMRPASTSIYYLLEKGDFSAFHRIKSDELWHHYEGATLEILVLHRSGELEILRLGKNFDRGERPSHRVEKGLWFASRVSGEGHALVGCTVAPGFDFKDFELAKREELLSSFLQHKDMILELTR